MPHLQNANPASQGSIKRCFFRIRGRLTIWRHPLRYKRNFGRILAGFRDFSAFLEKRCFQRICRQTPLGKASFECLFVEKSHGISIGYIYSPEFGQIWQDSGRIFMIFVIFEVKNRFFRQKINFFKVLQTFRGCFLSGLDRLNGIVSTSKPFFDTTCRF